MRLYGPLILFLKYQSQAARRLDDRTAPLLDPTETRAPLSLQKIFDDLPAFQDREMEARWQSCRYRRDRLRESPTAHPTMAADLTIAAQAPLPPTPRYGRATAGRPSPAETVPQTTEPGSISTALQRETPGLGLYTHTTAVTSPPDLTPQHVHTGLTPQQTHTTVEPAPPRLAQDTITPSDETGECISRPPSEHQPQRQDHEDQLGFRQTLPTPLLCHFPFR